MGLNVSGATPTAPLKAETKVEAITPDDVMKEIASAQKRMDADRVDAQNPGIWRRTKEVFNSGAKAEREAQIKAAQKMDKLLDDLYEMVAKCYQGMVNPQSGNA